MTDTGGLAKAGCWVDGDRVRFPSRLVEWAIEVTPCRVMLCDRRGRPAVALEGGRAYFGTGSDTPSIVDAYTGERRRTLKQDLANTAKLVDALPHMSFMMCAGIASDVYEPISDIHHFEAMASHTVKPIAFTAWSLHWFSRRISDPLLWAGTCAVLLAQGFASIFFGHVENYAWVSAAVVAGIRLPAFQRR